MRLTEVGRAISALRIATPGAIAAGPVLFERLDWRPYNVRAVPPLAAQDPPGEATRLDPFRGKLAAELVRRLVDGSSDGDVLEALERYEIALFARGSHRADELREALVTLLGGEEGPGQRPCGRRRCSARPARPRRASQCPARTRRRGRPGCSCRGRRTSSPRRDDARESRESLIATLDDASSACVRGRRSRRLRGFSPRVEPAPMTPGRFRHSRYHPRADRACYALRSGPWTRQDADRPARADR